MKSYIKPRGNPRGFIRNWAVPVGCGLLFLFLLKCVFFIGYVPSASMEPAIREGSLIIGVRLFGKLEHGDVVAFWHKGRLMVKRITGVPGDIITVLSGEVLTIPEGCYFVLGDNAEHSYDSRYWEDPFVLKEGVIALLLPS